MGEFRQSAPWGGSRSDEMRTPDEVAAMLRLKRLGWGVRRIAREFGCSHMTVRRYFTRKKKSYSGPFGKQLRRFPHKLSTPGVNRTCSGPSRGSEESRSPQVQLSRCS